MTSDFPYPLTEVSPPEALAVLERLSRTPGQSGLIVGTGESVELLAETFVPPPGDRQAGVPAQPGPTEILTSAASLRFPADYEVFLRTLAADDGELEPEEGIWPDAGFETLGVEDAIVGLASAGGAGTDKLFVATLPTNDPAEAPAYLHYGGWNAYPPADHHVAALRSWQRRYGARLVAMTSDIVVLSVERPVTDPDEALTLARELYRYCPDSVDQGTGTVQILAAGLIGATAWGFWWD